MIIFVDDAIPTFENAAVYITITTEKLMHDATIYTAKVMMGGFNGTIHYHLDASSTQWFNIDTNTGVIDVLTESRPVGDFVIEVFAFYGLTTSRTGKMMLIVTITGDWTSSTPAVSQTSPTPRSTSSQNSGDIFTLFMLTIFALVVAKKF